MPSSRFLLAACIVALSSFASAQRVAESVEVTVVEVPVTVRDRGGNAVRGLTGQNFEVLVDGKRVPIDYFEVVDLAKVTAGQRGLPVAAYRNFLLLFDVANSTPGTTGRAQEAAKTFIESQLRDRDLAAVGTMTDQQGAVMLTSFTRDKALLLAAVNSLGGAEYFKTGDPLLISANYTRELGPAMPAPSREGTGREARNEAFAEQREDMKDLNRRSNVAEDNEHRGRIRTQLQNFGSVARALDGLQGQKQIILLSEGFDARLLSGREDLSFKNTQVENDAVASGEIWKVDDEQRFGSARGIGEIGDMAEIFRRSDVRLHAIDIKGLRGNVNTRDGLQRTSGEGLSLLTAPTGGTVFRHGNDLSGQFASLLQQQEVIYVLGLKAHDPRPGQFHPLRVKLVGAKGEITHRSGYHDQKAGMSDLEATMRFSQMLMTGAEIKDVPLTVTAMPVPGADGEARVAIIVEAAGEPFLRGIEGGEASANIFVYAFDEKGQVRDSAQQRLALDVVRVGDTVRATGVRFVGSLHLPAGRYSVKALMRVDETGRMGLTTADVVVPDFGETGVLTPVVAGSVGRWVTVVSRAWGGEAMSLLSLGDRPFVPLSRVELSPGGADQDIALMLRGIDTEDLAITPALLAADGTSRPVSVQLAGRLEPDEHGMALLLFRLQPQAIAAGDYELQFTVAPKGTGPTTVKMPLIVR